MPRFTPGPWRIVEGKFGSAEFAWVEADIDDAPVICGVFTRVRGHIEDEDRANVTLIAAAPDLYAACEEIKLYLEQMDDREWERLDREHGTPPPHHVLVAALAKARGESQG